MAHAALRRDEPVSLEVSGIVRSAVFPNAVRDMRRRKGFATLREFDDKVDVTYTRLAKIERGEIFPAAEELNSIAKALKVPVGQLLIDPSRKNFDREKWAREHIEAKLQNRGGGMEAMRLGAAMRVRRLALGRSTTDMRQFGLPAATVSRIENAERPIERWDAATTKGIAAVLGVSSLSQVDGVVSRMFDAGELDDMLATLFSPEAIEERNRRRLKVLLADLPGARAAKLLQDLLPHVDVAVLSTTDLSDGSFGVGPSTRSVRMDDMGSPTLVAVEMAAPVIGPGLPTGCVVVADTARAPVSGDVAVVREGDVVRVVIVSEIDGRMTGVSMGAGAPVQLSPAPEGATVATMVKMIL